MKRVAIIAAGLVAAAPLGAQEVPAAEERVHVVREGDTLWDIARSYLNDPLLWPELFRLNAEIVQDPARIYPSERIRLPAAAGRATPVAAREVPSDGTVFRTVTGQPQGAAHTIRRAGTADVPVLTPGDYYRSGLLVPEAEVEPLGALVEVFSPSAISRGIPPQINIYDKVFVLLDNPSAVAVGDRLHFFRKGERVRPYGRLYLSTGVGTVAALDGQTATVVVIDLHHKMSVGDITVPLSRFPVIPGVAPKPAEGLTGEIIATQGNGPLYGIQDVVFINAGAESGVKEGDEFVAYLPDLKRRWGNRPQADIARLQVLRTTRNTAAARVTDLTYPALEKGLPVRKVAAMP